jgi:BASS family bile acid:Na+ symporter
MKLAVLLVIIYFVFYFVAPDYALSALLLTGVSTGVVMLGNINNVLVIVFASEFFGPVEPLVAAMYMIPFFVIVIPLRCYHHRKTITA